MGFHRYSEHRQIGDRGCHAWQVGGPPRTGDDRFQAAPPGFPGVGEELVRRAVGADNLRLPCHAEVLERARRVLHRRPIRRAAHDDPDKGRCHAGETQDTRTQDARLEFSGLRYAAELQS